MATHNGYTLIVFSRSGQAHWSVHDKIQRTPLARGQADSVEAGKKVAEYHLQTIRDSLVPA